MCSYSDCIVVSLATLNPSSGLGLAPVLGAVSGVAGLLNLGLTGVNVMQCHSMSKALNQVDAKMNVVLVCNMDMHTCAHCKTGST